MLKNPTIFNRFFKISHFSIRFAPFFTLQALINLKYLIMKLMKIAPILFIAFFSAFFLNAQEVEILDTEKPVINENYTTYKQKLSYINIPITISLKDVESMINKEYGDVIYEDMSFDNNKKDDLKVKVQKRKKIIVGTMDNKVKCIIPLKIWAAKQVRQSILGQELKQSADTEFEVTIIYNIDLKIKSDWTLYSQTVGKFKWDKKPYISVGGLIDIPLEGQLEAPLKEQVDLIAKDIDKAIKEAIDLKAIGTEAWSMAQEPMLMDSTTNAWLYINPKTVYATPLRLKYGKAQFKLGISTYVSNTFGEPKKEIKTTALKPLKIVKTIPDDFSIVLSAVATYDGIRAILQTQFVNQTFTQDDQEITITEMDFFGGADKVVIKVGIDGRLKKGILKKNIRGALYLEGVPYYDSTDMTIKIRDLDYTLATRDVLLKTAKWLSDKKIQQMMADNLVFPVGDQITEAKAMIEKELKNVEVNEYATVSGTLKDLRPQGIYLTEDAIQVIILADGKVNMRIGGF